MGIPVPEAPVESAASAGYRWPFASANGYSVLRTFGGGLAATYVATDAPQPASTTSCGAVRALLHGDR